MYDTNAFIADVGGYLGLLLGQSIIAIFDIVVSNASGVRKYEELNLTNSYKFI